MSTDAILRQAQRIGDEISHSEEAGRYWQALDKMHRNQDAQRLFETLKLKTNNLLALQGRVAKDHPTLQSVQVEVQALEEQLNGIPVAMQYKEAQAELNELVQGVLQIVFVNLSKQVSLEFGPKQGCGQGPDGNGCNCGGH